MRDKYLNRHSFVIVVGVVAFLASAVPAIAQTDPTTMLGQYASAQANWQNAIAPYAIKLFKGLAAIDFAWTCITVALEKQDMQGVVAAIIKKLMTIGIFWILLAYAPDWFPRIIQSFIQIGGSASGLPTPMDPSAIFTQGFAIAGQMWNAAANNTSLLTNPIAGIVGGMALLVAGIVIVGCYLVITIHFIMAMVESYLVLGAGYIFLGFGGSRWTSNYTERYVSLVISVGARLMVLYLVIGVGQLFATQWIAAVTLATDPANPTAFTIVAVFTIAAQVVIYAIVCWIVPKIAGNVIGGTLSVSGGDAFGFAAAGATAGIAAASAVLAATGVGAPAAAGAAAVTSAANAAGAGAAAGTIGGAAGTIAGGASAGGSAVAGAGGAAGFGSSAFAAPASGTSAGTAASTSGAASSSVAGSTGAATQPAPPASAFASSNGGSNGSSGNGAPGSTGSGSGGSSSPGTRTVAQPPPPAAELAAARAESGAGKAEKIAAKLKQGIDATIGRAPEGPTISGAGLNIGHAAE